MARIRTIKPDFFTSEDIVNLSPLARLLYIALWCEADREGRMAWKPRTFKLRYMPGDECDVDVLCAEIVDRKLVVLYGDGLAYIPAFGEHQHVNPRESVSCLPAPDASPRVRTRGARDSDAQVGREGKGKEGRDKGASRDAKSRKTSLPNDFAISERVHRWASEKGISRIEERFEHFVGVAQAKGYTYADWDVALMNAIRDDWAKFGHTPVQSLSSFPELRA
ncbi:hypothetical protein LYSHEL_21530 [Lysobacter helvus]|nr:hypothetical protein [Lysobacter helvus]BCT96282.1 hypothetical protein LYSHEL_21530 [Lysobacter helvus]